MSWREWFERNGNAQLQSQILRPAVGTLVTFMAEHQIEEMYQAFKARLIEELKVESPELLNQADIVDNPASPRPWY
jgi:hypothetical protein